MHPTAKSDGLLPDAWISASTKDGSAVLPGCDWWLTTEIIIITAITPWGWRTTYLKPPTGEFGL
jgi:hypothetical protein